MNANQRLKDFIYDQQVEEYLKYVKIMCAKKELSPYDKWNVLCEFVRPETLLTHPEIDWGYMWSILSKSSNIPWEFIRDNPQLPWNWDFVTENPNITLKIAKENPKYPWDFKFINEKEIERIRKTLTKSYKPQYTINEDNIMTVNPACDMYLLSKNPELTWDIIKNNLNLDWCWREISQHECITWDIIQNNPHVPWNWMYVSKNPNITCDIIENNPKCSWYLDHFVRIRSLKNINLNFVDKHKYLCWNWKALSEHPDITIEFITKYYIPGRFDWGAISKNPAITFDDIKRNPFLPWNIDFFCSNPNLTLEVVKNNPVIGWNWTMITRNPNITMDIIQDNLDCPWVWSSLRFNPNITWDFIKRNYDKGIYLCSSINHIDMPLDFMFAGIESEKFKDCDKYILYRLPDLVMGKCILKWNAANKIRKWWLFKCYLNPFHPVGQKRLELSYQEMVNETH